MFDLKTISNFYLMKKVQIPSPLSVLCRYLLFIDWNHCEICQRYENVYWTALRSPGNVAAVMFKLSRVAGGSVVSAYGHLIADTLRMGKTSYRRPPVQTEIFSKIRNFYCISVSTFSCE